MLSGYTASLASGLAHAEYTRLGVVNMTAALITNAAVIHLQDSHLDIVSCLDEYPVADALSLTALKLALVRQSATVGQTLLLSNIQFVLSITVPNDSNVVMMYDCTTVCLSKFPPSSMGVLIA